MNTTIIFPEPNNTICKDIYYVWHIKYVAEIFKFKNWNVVYSNLAKLYPTAFEVVVDSKLILFDFADSIEVNENHYKYEYVFKFHLTESKEKEYKNVHPWSPISFYDWNQYFNVVRLIQYTPKDIVLSNQKPYGNALQRRNEVQKNLTKNLLHFDNIITDQLTFWNKINNCLVSVCIPGNRIDILDRGQIQYFGFGCPTISPELNIKFIKDKLIPDVHYIKCKNDFSDVLYLIDSLKQNPNKLVQIGQNAQKIFFNNCTPEHLIKYFSSVINLSSDS